MVITDEKKIERLLTRGVENVLVKEELRKKLLSGKKLKVYLGIDPTGPTLHMGHMIPILKLKEFQDLGHQVVLLIGDFTAMIGDPTDKMATRKPLTKIEVKNNLKKYKKQASTFLKFTGANKAEFAFNSTWLSKMSFEDVLSLASHMTVDQMLKRDMFAQRNKEGKPIFLHEFMYPLMQGYDSVAMEVDVEVGGNDQTFNMLAGRNLAREIIKKDKDVISMKLLADNTGKKMGKTEGNMIAFEDTPENMFGKVMSWNDSLIEIGFELCTNIEKENIPKTDNPKELKMFLANAIVAMFFGEDMAKDARYDWVKKFEKKEIPDELLELKGEGKTLMEILVENKILVSNGAYRRLVEEGAVLDLDTKQKVGNPQFTPEKGQKFKIGKKVFIEIK